MSATISIVDIKENTLDDYKMKELMKKEFEVPNDEINEIFSDIKGLIKKLMNDGKLETEDCIPLFTICYYVLKEYIVKEYSTASRNSVILNINHITGKVH